jgi:murein DD-endopeptidase MepM/ murein hydrolase activator NlpD
MPSSLTRNPKSEDRNPRKARNPNSEFRTSQRETLGFRASDFGFLSGFGFRVSNFKVRALVILFVALLAGLVTCYCVATGPEDLSQYPPAAESPYRLPWASGQSHLCVQSNRGVVSHRGRERYAYDFAMPVGTEICAARGGKVVTVVVSHDGHGYHWTNNLVAIVHDDQTRGYYLHLKKDGGRVKVGDVVKQGQVIAESGHVGNSMLPHLHFHVTDSDRKSTLPISFCDVTNDAGIPRMFKTYTSGNLAPQ